MIEIGKLYKVRHNSPSGCSFPSIPEGTIVLTISSMQLGDDHILFHCLTSSGYMYVFYDVELLNFL